MFILAALVILVVLWFYFKPAWAPEPPDTRDISARAERVSQKGKQLYRGIRGRLKWRADKQELAQRFRQWAAESGGARTRLAESLPGSAEGFTTWLGRLSDKEAGEFSQDVARFCASQNFDMAWLSDPQVNAEPPLNQAVEDAVLLYGVACWRANQVQYDVKAMKMLKAFLAAPGRHKAFGQELFTALAEQGVVQLPAGMMTASEKERLSYMANAIQQASQKQPGEFALLLHRVVNRLDLPSAEPAAPGPQTPAPRLARGKSQATPGGAE